MYKGILKHNGDFNGRVILILTVDE